MKNISRRKRLGIKKELMLALLPTVTILIVLALVEALSNQRLLFASLASSAFSIYLDPEHAVNKVSTLVFSQIGAALIGTLVCSLLGPGYLSGGLAMVLAIIAMIVRDAVHPPAVSTALSFGLKSDDESNIVLFFLAVGITAVLVFLQRVALWTLRRID